MMSIFNCMIKVIFLFTFTVHKTSQVHALQCYVCNSAANNQQACVDNPAKINKSIECSSTDTCVTTIIDSATHRGCKSSVLSSGSHSPNTETLYEICDTPLCNGWIFPRDRRLCYQCKDWSCQNTTRIYPSACRNYVKDDGCYSHEIRKGLIIRGCLSELKGPCIMPQCFICKTSGCNNFITLATKVLKCYSCSYIKGVTGLTDPSCKRPQSATEKCGVSGLKTCTNMLPRKNSKCFTWYNKNGVVMRGCSQTMGHLGDGKLSECEGDLCNDDCIDIKCLQCDSKKDYKCINSTKHMQEKSCPAGTNSCFACENKNGHVIRGCGSGLDGFHCIPCYGDDGCNRQPIRTCYRCSSGFDPNCAKWVKITNIDLEVCKNPLDECVTTVKPNSYTVRGCRESVPECTESDPFCIRCNGSLCNGGVFPVGRRNCYQCSGSDECNKGLGEPTPCANYDSHDYCFAFANDLGQIVRGCQSDESFNSCRKLAKTGKCRVCYENDCNRWPLERDSTLTCIKCNQTNEACAWGFFEDSAELCQSPVPYHIDESCFTYNDKKGNVSRGCTLDTSEDLSESRRVQLCYSPGCNSKNTISQSCVQCTTKDGPSICEDLAANISSTDCECGTIQTFQKRGCYIKRHPDDYIVRGCSCQLDDEEFNNCKTAEKETCIHCTGQGCNTENLQTDSSNAIQFNCPFIMFSGAIITIVFGIK